MFIFSVGSDYSAVNADVVIAVGDTIQCFNVLITNDAIFENTESFGLQVSSSDDDVVTGADSMVTIMDNDGGWQLTKEQ